jgi:hypothetical protein
MITIFSTPKPFVGSIRIAQENAIRSWRKVFPEAEIIIYGDEEGVEEACRDSGARWEPKVKRDGVGCKFLDHIFNGAESIASHDHLCYINSDIILTEDFRLASKTAIRSRKHFLMVGQRWDMRFEMSVDFDRANWSACLRESLATKGSLHPATGSDYFLFPRGLYHGRLPPLVIGRIGWDNWLIYDARRRAFPVIDASDSTKPIHQNHDYSYCHEGQTGVWSGPEARRNIELAGGKNCIFTLDDATHRLARSKVRRIRDLERLEIRWGRQPVLDLEQSYWAFNRRRLLFHVWRRRNAFPPQSWRYIASVLMK